jgi:hypothetical protein
LNEQLIQAIQRIIDSSELVKNLLLCENIEEMYLFLKQFGSDFTVEDLEILMTEVFSVIYSNHKLEDEKLDIVSGGKTTIAP